MSALTDTFTSIANAIRAKLGVSTTYTPAQMASAIASIPKAVLQTKTQTVTPSANWSGTNTNNATISPDGGYDGMSQVNVNVPMLRDNTLMTADTVDTPGTVYNGNTSQSNSQKLLRMHPTKDGMSYTESYLYMKPNSYLGDAAASDVVSGKTFSSSNGIQLSGSGKGYTIETIHTWSLQEFSSYSLGTLPTTTRYDFHKITFQRTTTDTRKYELIIPVFNDNYPTGDVYREFCAGIFMRGDSAGNSYGFRSVYVMTKDYDSTRITYDMGISSCIQYDYSDNKMQYQKSWLVPIKWEAIILK